MRALLSLALGAGLLACAPRAAMMKVEQDSLGRVVVYRNGVAYYERRVQVTGDQLAVTVPRLRVDDFLKSLTVIDNRTGNPVPVSFGREQAEQSGNVAMIMKLPHVGVHDLKLTYVTESPAWKPSYRVVVGDDGKVSLQGWAIVDNTSGEQWRGVRVGVGSSSALSFRYDLWSVRDVHRQTLRGEERFAAAPPAGVSPYRQGQQPMVATLDDGEIARPKDHPDSAPDEDSDGSYYELESSGGGVISTVLGLEGEDGRPGVGPPAGRPRWSSPSV